MNGVLVDFAKRLTSLTENEKQEFEDRLDEIAGILSNLEPISGAIEVLKFYRITLMAISCQLHHGTTPLLRAIKYYGYKNIFPMLVKRDLYLHIEKIQIREIF
jgi:hypothetical protein